MEGHSHWRKHIFRDGGAPVTVYIAKIEKDNTTKVSVGRKAATSSEEMAVETISIRSGNAPEGQIIDFSRRIYSQRDGRTRFLREERVPTPDRLAIVGLIDYLQQERGEGLFVSPGYAWLNLLDARDRFYAPVDPPSFDERGCCRRALAQLCWRIKQCLSRDVARYEQAKRDGLPD